MNELAKFCADALHESYKGDSTAYKSFADAPKGIREKTLRDVGTILRAAIQHGRLVAGSPALLIEPVAG